MQNLPFLRVVLLNFYTFLRPNLIFRFYTFSTLFSKTCKITVFQKPRPHAASSVQALTGRRFWPPQSHSSSTKFFYSFHLSENSKCVSPHGIVGSNPTVSAIQSLPYAGALGRLFPCPNNAPATLPVWSCADISRWA